MTPGFGTVDEYLASVLEEVRDELEGIRRAVHAALPDSGERISYQMPTITLGGRNVLHFAAWARHIAVYPVPEGDEALERRLAPYRAAKGTLRFPLDEPVPHDLVAEVAVALAERRRRRVSPRRPGRRTAGRR